LGGIFSAALDVDGPHMEDFRDCNLEAARELLEQDTNLINQG
jgi:hypothetical protein